MPEVATKRKAASSPKEEPKRGRGRPKGTADSAEKPAAPAPSPKKAATSSDGEPKKRGRGRPPKDGVKAKPKKLKYPGKGRGRPKATDVPVAASDDDE